MQKLNVAALQEELARPDLSFKDRAFLTEQLAAYERLITENPLQRYEPHPKQVRFHEARTTIKAFLGGNRSGKTTAGIVDDLIQAVDEGCLPPELRAFKKWQPPFFCRIVTPDFTSTMEGVVFEAIREWVPRSQLFGGSWEKAYHKQLRRLDFKNGSFFEFMTYEQDLDKFGGAARMRVHFDEEPPQAIRKECNARIIDYAGDELFTMTPLHGMTWMFDDVYERRYEPNVTVVEVATDENPHINKEAMEEFFATLTDEEREARRKGRFVHFGGLVLSMFDDDENLVDELQVEDRGGKRFTPALKGLERLVGIDPGIVRGGVVWCAIDRDNHMLVFHELYPKNLTIPEIATQIRAVNAWYGIEPDSYIIDPSGRNRSLTNAVNVQTEFMQEGISTVPGQNDRITGVLQLRRRLVARPAALKVTRNCVMWLREKGRWRVSEDEETSEDKAEGDTFKTAGPDHLMDPTRYVAMARVWGPALADFNRRRRSAYQHNHEEPWTPSRRYAQSGPMGAMS